MNYINRPKECYTQEEWIEYLEESIRELRKEKENLKKEKWELKSRLEEENKKLKETIKDHQLYEEKLEHRIIEFEELLHWE